MEMSHDSVQEADQNLQFLSGVETLVIKQKLEMLEIFTGFETNNKYEIKDGQGKLLCYAVEETNIFSRLCCGADRSFTIHVLGFGGISAISYKAGIKCFGQTIKVEAPAGTTTAMLKRTTRCFWPIIYVKTADGDNVFKISPPFAALCCGTCSSVGFDVKSLKVAGEPVVASITKEWGGILREAFTDADTFGIQFPADMEPKWKAALLGALFVIDFAFYEKSTKTANK